MGDDENKGPENPPTTVGVNLLAVADFVRSWWARRKDDRDRRRRVRDWRTRD